jgi:hypothetical protein
MVAGRDIGDGDDEERHPGRHQQRVEHFNLLATLGRALRRASPRDRLPALKLPLHRLDEGIEGRVGQAVVAGVNTWTAQNRVAARKDSI